MQQLDRIVVGLRLASGDDLVAERRDEGVVAGPAVLAEEVGEEYVDEVEAEFLGHFCKDLGRLLLAVAVGAAVAGLNAVGEDEPGLDVGRADRVRDGLGEGDVSGDDFFIACAVDAGDVDDRVGSRHKSGKVRNGCPIDGDDLVVVQRMQAATQVPTKESAGACDHDLHADASTSARNCGSFIRSAFTCSMSRRSVLCEL